MAALIGLNAGREKRRIWLHFRNISLPMDTMKHKFGQVGDDRLILMASLMVTDELWEARRQLQELKGAMAELRRDRSTADESSKVMRADLADTIRGAADRLDELS